MIPEAIELEKKVIGTIMTFPEYMPEIAMILTPEMFFDNTTRLVYSGLLHAYENNEPLDLLSTVERHNQKKDVKMPYLVDLTQMVGSGVETTSNCFTIKEKYIARELAIGGQRIYNLASDSINDIEDVLKESNKLIDRVNELVIGNSGSKHISSSVEKSLKDAEKRQVRSQKGLSVGISTGLTDLDKILGGWQNSTLNILAARPSMGKTNLLLKFAKCAAEAGFPGCIYSLEMSDISLTNRFILSECDIDIERFKSGHLTTKEWQAVEEASARISKLPIYIDDNPIVSMRYIKSNSTVMHRKGKCSWIMIDYLQLTETEKSGTREQEIAKASRAAKIIAKELDLPVILLSQLSRAVETRADKKPNLSDLRESGSIEQDADTVTFIYRPAYYGLLTASLKQTGKEIDTRNFGQLIIAKQREGAVGTVNFLHNDSMTKIFDYSEDKHNELIGKQPKIQIEDEPF